jgi:hypothetical protein
MTPNPYLYEKYVRVHHDELLREAEQHRLLAQLPGHNSHHMRNIATRFRAFLAGFSSSSVKAAQPSRALTGQL